MEDQKALESRTKVSQFHVMDLPAVVLHEILFRLPINSIMNVKLVCTAFYKLISNPDFALNYSNNSPFASFLLPKNLCCDSLRYHDLVLVEVSDNNNVECIQTTFKPKIPDWSKRRSEFRLAGTCNGLVCLALRKSWTEFIYICNPIMGECMPLPELKIKSREIFCPEYRFGFCTSTSNYKVLRISCLGNGPGKPREGQIFSIGIDNTWRDLVIPRIPFDCIALNGVFHGIVLDNNSSISTFDLGEEKVGQLSHPHGLVLDPSLMRLESTNNHLCLLNCTDPSVIVLWKMKEYGVAESWTKDMILDISFTSELRCWRPVPETILQNGDILFCTQMGDSVISYNPTKKKVTKIRVRCNGTITYTPNFLSLKEALAGGHQSSMNL